MGAWPGRREDGEGPFEILAELTARLASTQCLDDIAGAVLDQIAALGFGMVWMATYEEATGHLLTVKEVIEGVDTTIGSMEVVLDTRRPLGHAFRQRRIVNVKDPSSLFILDEDTEPIPPGVLALPRGMYTHLRGSPFATGPLLASSGHPVGALGLCAYHGRQVIPDDLFHGGLLRALIHHLGIATERALQTSRLERAHAELVRVREALTRDTRLKAVGELAAAVAHDLNNLSGIALLAASAGSRSPAAASEALRSIERANRTMSDLVGRLQRVARIGADGAGGETDAAEPVEVVQDILLMMTPMLREHSIQVELDLRPAPAVRVDPSLLHQVMLNLVLNARDAMEEVAPNRRALLVRLHEDEGGVRITVADSGPGIAPKALTGMFRPFTTTKGAHHLGIGLAASRASLERYGAQLSGRNAPGGGAVFEVWLERARSPHQVAEARDRPRERRALGSAVTRAPTAPPRILVVDDDTDLVKLVAAFLEPLGYQVSTASDVSKALALATAQAFDLILCDVGLPGRGGLEIGRELRQSGFAGKIVLMTGWDGHAIATQQPAAVYDRLLKKPFYGEDLLRALEMTLGS